VDVTHIVALAKLGGCEINCLRVISALPELRHRVFVLGKEGPMSDRWRETGVAVQHLDVLRLGPVAFERRLRALASAGRFQGTVLYWSNSRLFWVWRALSRAVPALTVHLGNPYGAGVLGRLRDSIYERLTPSRNGLRLVACSQAVAESFRNAPYFRGAPLEVVPNPVENTEPKAAHRALSVGADVRLGMVARLDPIKDHATAICAMPAILQKFPRATLELAGDGVLKNELAALAAQQGVAHAVRFLGPVKNIYNLIRSWDVFVYSTTRAEGMGIAVAEALMAGLPVVASDLPVMREVCGEAAVYFSAGDPSALANTVCDLVADEAHRSALGASAAKHARVCFAPETIARRYLAVAEKGQST